MGGALYVRFIHQLKTELIGIKESILVHKNENLFKSRNMFFFYPAVATAVTVGCGVEHEK